MARVAIFIGVKKTGNLPTLPDAQGSAERMAAWAAQEGMRVPPALTDKIQPVTAKLIKDAIKAELDKGDVEQLFVYFAGHGVNVRMGEYWLLSGAPDDSQEAVNVRGSDDLARYCGVPHVVLISDACRTAADTIQAQNVSGSEIFPNSNLSGTQKPVDLFYACTLGRPAHEVRDVNIAASEFRAIYTEELLAALSFGHAPLIEWSGAPPNKFGYVRPRPLRDHMSRAVATRIQGLNLQTKLIQIPDAHITSDPDAWLARKNAGAPPAAPPAAPAGPAGPAAPGGGADIFRGAVRDAAVAAAAVAGAAIGPTSMAMALSMARSLVNLAVQDPTVAGAAMGASPPFGPVHYETQCGFKLRGARLSGVFVRNATAQRVGPSNELVRIAGLGRPGANVLLVLENGDGLVLPAMPEFIAAVTVEDGEVVDVSYEPSDNSARWGEYQQHARELRVLRKAVAAATRAGVFRLEGDNVLSLARRLQYSKGVDPSLAVYAAYAYHDLRRDDLTRQMNEYMTGDLGAPLFDVALMARAIGRGGEASPTLGFAPLLAQGWAYLSARRIRLPQGLDDLRGTLKESVWTLFDAGGVDRLRKTIFEGAQPWQQAG